jgi:hypothetical protein
VASACKDWAARSIKENRLLPKDRVAPVRPIGGLVVRQADPAAAAALFPAVQRR